MRVAITSFTRRALAVLSPATVSCGADSKKHSGKISKSWSQVGKKFGAIFCAIAIAVSTVTPAQAADERRLKFYYTHTKERIDIVYKRNGKYVPSALRKLNKFFRDWRQNEQVKMDPRLFDLIWSVYQQMDTKEAIHVVSAYRSPKTNNMLRRRGRGVAKNSQHTRGKAMDFFIPGVPLDKLRAAGLRMHVGGVGYYPRSGSPFVHLDTGSVRHWPRMTDKQLAKVFPKGNTTHVGTSGKRLAGYDAALRRQQQIADAEISPPNQRRGGIFARVFNRNQDPATVPTTGQSLTSASPGEASQPQQLTEKPIDLASAPLPKFKPASEPTDLLPEDPIMTALLSDAPQPRPAPAPEVVEQPTAIAGTAETEPEVQPQRDFRTAWSQVGDRQSQDISSIIDQSPETETGADTLAEAESEPDGQAPELARAVLAAMQEDETPAQPEPAATESPEARIAAAILRPSANGSTSEDSPPSEEERALVTAYAPTTPLPDERPPFQAALGTDEQDPAEPVIAGESISSGLRATLPPAEDAPLREDISLAALPTTPPRARPSLPQPARSERAQLAAQPREIRSQAPSDGGLLVFAAGHRSTLSKLSRPDTTRSTTFAELHMPNPYRMAGAFAVPTTIVDNSFSRSSTSLRTDIFTGRAIVATRVARLY